MRALTGAGPERDTAAPSEGRSIEPASLRPRDYRPCSTAAPASTRSPLPAAARLSSLTRRRPDPGGPTPARRKRRAWRDPAGGAAGGGRALPCSALHGPRGDGSGRPAARNGAAMEIGTEISRKIRVREKRPGLDPDPRSRGWAPPTAEGPGYLRPPPRAGPPRARHRRVPFSRGKEAVGRTGSRGTPWAPAFPGEGCRQGS